MRRPAPTASRPLINADDADAVRAVGGAYLHLVAHPVPDQRLAERGLVAHPPRLGVRLGGPDDAVGLLVLAVLSELDRAAHLDQPRRSAMALDQDVVLEDDLELVDAGFQEAL